jgi:hypothetical protein
MDIYLRVPVNRTAALVTNQRGCNDDPSLEDQRDCLIRALAAIEQRILSLPKNHDWRKDLGVKKQEVQAELSLINKRIKINNVLSRDINEYVLQICKASTPRDKWLSILKRAEAMKQDELKKLSD